VRPAAPPPLPPVEVGEVVPVPVEVRVREEAREEALERTEEREEPVCVEEVPVSVDEGTEEVSPQRDA